MTLQKVAAVMRQAIRDSDRIYRYGGEEFVIIFSGAGRTKPSCSPIAYSGPWPKRRSRAISWSLWPCDASAGLAIMPDHGGDIADLIVLADRAMYRAKQSGRNRIEIWDENAPQTVASAA